MHVSFFFLILEKFLHIFYSTSVVCVYLSIFFTILLFLIYSSSENIDISFNNKKKNHKPTNLFNELAGNARIVLVHRTRWCDLYRQLYCRWEWLPSGGYPYSNASTIEGRWRCTTTIQLLNYVEWVNVCIVYAHKQLSNKINHILC